MEDLVKKFEGLRSRYSAVENQFTAMNAKKETLEASLNEALKTLKDKFGIASLEEAQTILNKKFAEINEKFSSYEAKIAEYEKVITEFKMKGI